LDCPKKLNTFQGHFFRYRKELIFLGNEQFINLVEFGKHHFNPKKRSWLRKAIDWIFGRKNRVIVTPGEMTGNREPDQSNQNATLGTTPTFSQAPDRPQFNTTGQVIQTFRDFSFPSYRANTLSNIMLKGTIDGIRCC
jgi:hypothetical protein